MPLDKFADFDLSSGFGTPANRGAFRIRIAGLVGIAKGFDVPFELQDISATGCGMVGPESVCNTLRSGRTLEMNIFAGKKLLVANVHTKIIRVLPGGIVACSFRGLAVEQEAILDKLILEMQKVAVRRRKKDETGQQD